jgi:hypothetical protein
VFEPAYNDLWKLVEAPAPMIWTPGAMADRIRTLERALRVVLKEIQPLPNPVPKQVTVSVPFAVVPVAIEQADLFHENKAVKADG